MIPQRLPFVVIAITPIDDREVAEILLEDIVSQDPVLMSLNDKRQAITHGNDEPRLSDDSASGEKSD